MNRIAKYSQVAWYHLLAKPSWAPPSWLFGPVWTILYITIALSFSAALYSAAVGAIPRWIALPFVLNLICTISFTPIRFGLRSSTLTSVDVLLTLATLIWGMIAVYPSIPWIAYANVPYVAWICFATALQLAITYLNRNSSIS